MAYEQQLLSDLKVPAEALPVFRECGVNTAALITWTKQNIFQALSRANINWKYDLIWALILEWRERNNLSTIAIYSRKSKVSDTIACEGSGLNCHPNCKPGGDEAVGESSGPSNYPDCCSSNGSVAEKTTRGNSSGPDCSPSGGKAVETIFGESSEDATEESIECNDTDLNSQPDCSSGTGVAEESHSAAIAENVDDEDDSLYSPGILKNLLKQSVFGIKLLQKAEELELSTEGQKFVTDVVAKYHLSRKRKTTSQLMEDYATVIVKVFKREQKDTYYIPKKGNPGGKLYSRINYIRQADRKRIKEEDNRQTFPKISETIFAPEILNGISWLQLNRLPWSNVLSQWEITFIDRKALLGDQKKIPNLFKKYPHFKDEFGFQLLDIDYRLLGYGDPSTGQNKWDQLLEPIGKYIDKHGKDISVSELLPVISSTDYSLDSRLLAVLRGLSTVLIPVKADNGFKPTIATAQSDTFLMVKTKEEAFEELEKLRNTWAEKGGAATPKLIVLGENTVIAFGECIVAYGNVHYTLPSIVRGIDVYVKLFVVLGLPPSKISKLIWLFILKYVYSIDKTCSYVSIKNLIKFIESCS